MFESIIEWMTLEAIIHKRATRNAAGDIETTASTEKCYRVDSIKVITDKNGKEYVSAAQIYFPGTTDVTVDDNIAYPEAPSKKYEIKKISNYFDGNTGIEDVKVVYL